MYQIRNFPRMWRWLHISLILTLLLTPLAGAVRAIQLPQTPLPPSTGAAPADASPTPASDDDGAPGPLSPQATTATSGLRGTLYDTPTMRGIVDGRIVARLQPTGTAYSGVTGIGGYYELAAPEGQYSVTGVAYGYISHTVHAEVHSWGSADVPLAPADFWNVSGQVTDANTGYPVYAQLAVTGDPFDPPAPTNATWSNGLTGDYLLPDLAGAIPYTLTITAEGYLSETYALGVLSAHLTDLDFALDPDLVACTAPGYELTPPCQPASGAVMHPARLETEGCPCETQSHTLYFVNHTGSEEEVLLSYETTPGVSAELPASLGVVPDTGVRPFEALVKIDRGVLYSTTVYVTVTAALASNPAISNTMVIAKRALEPVAWEARAESPAPSMDGAVIAYADKLYKVGGNGSGGAVNIYDPATGTWTNGAPEPSPIIDYPGDACFGYAAPDDPVILLLPDTSSGVTGVWHRYHIASNTWTTPTLPATLPANGIWMPDIVVDYRNNHCYITGGASASGGGNLTTLYRYDPAANTAVLLGNFTHIPAGFNLHAGWYAPWIGTAGGVCVGGGVDSSSVVYADTQCYDIAAATFTPPNADLGPLPEPWWGMADAEAVHASGRQLWVANGTDASWNLLQRSAYFSQENGEFVYGPDPLYTVYRVEGAAVGDQVYIVNGATGGFSASTLNEQLIQCPECDCGVDIAKSASAGWVHSGEVVTYTIVMTAPNWLTGTMELVDAPPPGATFTGHVEATYGTAWYSATENAIYWTRPPSPVLRRAAAIPPQPAVTPTAPSLALHEVASLSDLPHSQVTLAPTDSGDVLETFTNTWATNVIGLAYNPETDYMRYAHEGGYGVFNVDYPAPHPVRHNFKLSIVNPGWPASLDNRNGAGYDYTTGHYFLPDYQGDLSARDDHIVEIDPTGRIINAWETDGAGNDSYDGSVINRIIDIAVVPGAPPRYFVTAADDGNLVYEVDLRRAGQFVPDTWGTVMTCTVPGIGDTSGIDYDAQNGVLYHSDENSTNIVVTDLRCNVLDAFTCNNGVSGINTGVTFVEGKWPPEVWVTDWVSNRTTRCEAVGHEPHPEVVTVTYAVEATAPVSTTVVNKATLSYRGLSLATGAPAADVRYVAGTWSDDAIHLLDANLNDLGNFLAGATNPNGVATDGTTIWSGHPFQQAVIAYDFTGQELYRWSASLSALQGIDLVNGELAIHNTNIEFRDPRTGALNRTIPGQTSIEGLTFDGTLLWQLDNTWIYGTDPLDGSIVISITNAASGCLYGGTGMTAHAPGALTLACTNGNWYQVSSADGSIIMTGTNGLDMYGLAYLPTQRKMDTAKFHVAPRPTITWTKEIYVNGVFAGRHDEGPFTAAPGDVVHIVEQLDYTGPEPLFVTLDEDWNGYPLVLADETHTRGVVIDGDWYVTLLSGASERLAKTFRITDTAALTITEQLLPDGLPVEERTVSFAPPVFSKDGPAVAYPGQLITYTLTLDTHDPLVGSLRLTDTLPAGVTYMGNLHASYGVASYSAGDNAVYWSNAPASMLMTQHVLGAGAQSETGLSEETKSGVEAWPEIGPLSAQNALTPYSLLPTPSSPSATWFNAAPLPQGTVRYAHAQCPGEPNRFYIIAGVSNGSNIDKVWRYDADMDTWTALAPFPTPVEGPSAVCYGGHIYVAGGSGSNRFYIYDIVHDTWSAGPDLPRGVWGAAFGAWGGRLFLAGGDNDFIFGGQSDEVNIYDIATATWSGLGATMPISTNASGWTQVNEYLYVVGGWGDDPTTHNITATQRYNMMSNIWETGPTFTSGRSDFVLAATGRYLYAIGGDADGGGPWDAVTLTERLDYTNWSGDAWTDIADPLPAALTAYNGSFCTTTKSGGEIWSVGGIAAGFVFTSTSQYRPSEPCVTIPPTVTLTFNARVTAGPGERVTNTATLDFRGAAFTATTTLEVLPPQAAWEKHISVNGVLTTTGVIKVVPGDEVQIVDQVWVTYTVPISFTLTEMWTEALTMTGIVADVGTVTWTPEGPATVLANNVAPNTWYAITKTFAIVEGDWLTGRVTETLAVESGATTSRLVHFAPPTTEHMIYLPLVLRNYTN